MNNIKTMRYLGNKTKHLKFINDTVQKYVKKNNLNKSIFDGFGGTGSVTHFFNLNDYNIISNDILRFSYYLCYSRNNIKLDDLKFDNLKMNIDEILEVLNNCKHKGFIYKNYSPNKSLKYIRKYFTNENAEIIDGIRIKIEEWYKNKKITYKEYIHLISILIETVSLYSNIAGTYGAFLKEWDTRSLKRLTLKKEISNNLLAKNNNKTYNKDINIIIKDIEADILYIDPPYNQRDYCMYFHVLETIAIYDNPKLKDNKTGTKYKYNKSKWCNKKKVLEELEFIIKNSKSKLIIMSYNNEGIIKENYIKNLFSKYGIYTVNKKIVKRFKSRKENKDIIVYEYLHILEKINNITKITDQYKVEENGEKKEEDKGEDKGEEKEEEKEEDKEEEREEENEEEKGEKDKEVLINKILNKCCLIGMKDIPDNYIDLICCDLPYGLTECKWDTVIDIDLLWGQYNRILKKNGTIILFGKQPFTSRLVSSNYKMFKYSLVWKKSKPGGFAQAPYKFLCEHEDILIFTEGKTTKNSKNRMTYNPQGTKKCNKKMKGKTGNTEHRKGRKKQKDYIQTTTNYPRSILEFKNEGKVKHPTQKPLKLIEYLIKTFSNENEIVLDNCMGSGTTAIACLNTNRSYIGYEKNKNYYNICIERINNN